MRGCGQAWVLAAVLVLSCESSNGTATDEHVAADVAQDPGSANDVASTDPGSVPDEGSSSDVAQDPGSDWDAKVDTVSGATKLILDDSNHTHHMNDQDSWRNPNCWACHTEDSHNEALDPYLCVTCHGRNGAEDGHGGATPCSGCHDVTTLATPHAAEGFPDPSSCQTCHVEPVER